jgi:recombination protein RecT
MATQAQQPQQPKPQAQAKPPDPMTDLRAYLESRKQHLTDVADGMIKAEQMVKVTLFAARKNSKLLECHFDSVFLALMKLAEAGLEPDGVEAALVPYGSECQAIEMYRGVCKLLYSSGMVKDVYADVFFSNEIDRGCYRFRKGSKSYVHHEPLLKDRGEVMGAYAVIHTITGGTLIDEMNVEDIERIRKFSKAKRDDSPWVVHWNEMAKKTVLKRCSKTGPQSKQLRALARLEGEEIEAEVVGREEFPPGTAGLRAAVARQLETPTVKETIETPQREPVPVQQEQREPGAEG